MSNSIDRESLKALIVSEAVDFLRGVPVDVYLDKALNHGEIISISDKDGVKGFVLYYANNVDEKVAFITLVLVSKRSRRQGVANGLLNGLLYYLRRAGFIRCDLEVRVDNLGAQALYASLGFLIAERRSDVVRMSVDLR